MEKPETEETWTKSTKNLKEIEKEQNNFNDLWYKNNLKIWLETLLQKLFLARKIDEFDRFNYFIDALIEINFKEYNKKAAEHWILLGDWRYKKSNSLLLADFSPTEEQLKSIGIEFISLERHNDIIEIVKKQTITTLKNSIEQRLESEYFMPKRMLSLEIIQHAKDMMESEDKIKTLNRKINDLIIEKSKLDTENLKQ